MTTPANPPAAAPVAMVWRFGSASLDEARMELSVAGVPVALERKPLEVLRHLLRHAGEVVTKEELQESVWPGRILSETVLTKAISRIREELDDTSAAAIKTVHGYGYRLIGEVSVMAPKLMARAAPELNLKAGDRPRNRANWMLDAHLDSGGHGEVWRVRHEKTGEQRVFKFALSGEGLAGLKREITLHRLFGSQLGELAPMVPVLDFNLEEAPFFLELDYIQGGSLSHWLEARGGAAQLPVAERLALFVKISQSVAQAHAVGVLHKDLKPANILIDEQNGEPNPLLADFGSAGVMSDHVLAEAGITQLGFTQYNAKSAATPLYLAPEVLRGQPFTTRSDLYALGVMLYQLLVGDLARPLATGWEANIADELLREDIAAATQGEPERRLTAVAELVQRLQTLAARREQREAERLRAQQAQEAEARAEKAQQLAERLGVRRTWMRVTAGVFLLGTLLASGLAVRARAAAAEARAANASTQATMRFLVDDVLGAVSLRHGPAKQMTVNQIIERSARMVEQRFPPRDLASRAQAYRALYEVYGVTDYTTLNPQFNDWLYAQVIGSLTTWFRQDPQAAYPLAYEAVVGADFWNDDAALLSLLDAASRYAQASETVPVGEKLALSVFQAEALVKQGRWVSASTALAALIPQLQPQLAGLLADEPYAVVAALNNASRVGLYPASKALCQAMLASLKTPALANDAGLKLDTFEACAAAAVARGDSRLALDLASQGLTLARANYDELVGYVPTFSRFLATALAGEGRMAEALPPADQAVNLRRARGDDLLPYALAHRGTLRDAAGQTAQALADYQEASKALEGRPLPLLAIEAHSRLARALARAGDAAGAAAALARIPATALAELPARHRGRAQLLQAQAWLQADPAAAAASLQEADGLLAAIGLPANHFARLELAADRLELQRRGS